jgi:hypothetical protein
MKEMFKNLRSLVRSGKLEACYARQIFQLHAKGKNISAGMAAWFGHGWKYDREIFGKMVDGDYLNSPNRIRDKSMIHLISETYLPRMKRKLP